MTTTLHPRLRRAALAFAMVAGLGPFAPAGAQVVANGSFETGLTGWTVGGTNQVAAVQSANFNPGPIAPPAGTTVAALSTGPGDVAGGAAFNLDNNGGNNDQDNATLAQTITIDPGVAGPAPYSIAFWWSFATSEQDQPNQFDDLFELTANGARIYSGSSCKNNGSSSSPFPNATCNGSTVLNWTITGAAPITNTALRYGVPAFQRTCVALPVTGTAPYTVALRFQVSDQADATFDSALLVDDIVVQSGACSPALSPSLTQVTATTGQTVEAKGGGFELRTVANGPLAVDGTGTNAAFVSSANLTGDNPNVIPQAYLYDGAVFSRVTGLNVLSGGAVQALDLSGPLDGTIRGRYVAIAAQLTQTGSLQIYRWDRSTSTLSTVTATTGCTNERPTISGNGNRIAFETSCNSLTGDGTTRKVVYATFAAGVWTVTDFMPAGACTGSNPRFNRTSTATVGRYIALESNCNPLGGANNSDANREIFRYDITGPTWLQVTTSTTSNAPGLGNASPMTDGRTDGDAGDHVWFVSTCNATACGATSAASNADGSPEVHHFDSDTPGAARQVTSSAATILYLVARPGADGVSDYGFERLSFASGLPVTELGRRSLTDTILDFVQFSIAPTGGVPSWGFGIEGASPTQVTWMFAATADDRLGTNADENEEMFRARSP